MTPFTLLNEIGTCLHAIDGAQGLIVALFLAGLVGGVTHCSFMCGPFLLSQNKSLQKTEKLSLKLPYHLGRLTTYIGLAVAFSSLVNLAYLFMPQRALLIAPLLAMAGLIFLVSAIPSFSRYFPWLYQFKGLLPIQWITPLSDQVQKTPRIIREYLLGVILGFMPCGLIIAALMAAASAPSVSQAALAMGAFGFGTTLILMAMSLGSQKLLKHFPRTARYIRGTMMVWSGAWLFIIAGFILI